MTSRKSYTARAVLSGDWWAITCPELTGIHSQVRRPAEAEAVAREAIGLFLNVPADSFELKVVLVLPPEIPADIVGAPKGTGAAADLIRMARQRAAISQGELARRSGIAQALIRRYESGKVQPTLPTLLRLMRGAGNTLTLELDGWHLIDTQRMPTDDEAQGIERAFVRMLEDQPPKIRRRHDAARKRWGRTLREFVDTGHPAFPRYNRES